MMLPWPGGGPLSILPECPAVVHNSLAAGRGRNYIVNGLTRREKLRCICPRALVCIEEDNADRRARQRLKASLKPKDRGPRVLTNVAAGTWVPASVHVPDLSDGMCRTPDGMRTFDKVITGVGNEHKAGVIGAKRLCGACPRRTYLACEKYVREGEGAHPGIWRGVWAGRTASERKAASRVE